MSVSGKTKGQLEAEITEAIIRFELEFMGRGPLEAKTYLIDDLVLVRLKNVLTLAEYKLSQDEVTGKGRSLIKQVRIELLEQGRQLLEVVINDILKVSVKSLHTDISTKTGERIIVFSLNGIPVFRER